ncbi:MAG: methyl-accepting chemotaxis protein [Pseudomonadota bacterium]
MKKTAVRAQLGWAFGGLALLVLIVAVFAIKGLHDANLRFENYVQGMGARLNAAHETQEAVQRRAIAVRNMVLRTKPEDIAAEKQVAVQSHAEVVSQLQKLKTLVQDAEATEEARRMVAEIDRIEQQYAPVALAIVDLAANQQREAAITKINDECLPLLRALEEATQQYVSYATKRAGQLAAASAAEYALQRNLLIAFCVLAFAFAVLAGWLITRRITRALGAEPDELSAAVTRVAEGDLTTELHVRAGDNSSVLAAVARMQAALRQVVANVRHTSDAVSVASAQIAAGNADLSARTENQASALEETAASMEELGSTVQQNADNARQANQFAQSASAVAQEGGEVVAQVVETMKGIHGSSQKIADIIGVIDGIAFQTNILALNAAVEAARAGEQGRGFAVVASEVRSLAGRSAQAAKEIKALITDSVTRIGQGSTLADQAGAKMADIVTGIRRVTDLMGEISAASSEQSAGVAQVGEAVSQMDQVTQQNAALVEQMAAAAASLNAQAQELVRTVALFKLDAAQAAQAVPAAAAPALQMPAPARMAGHLAQSPARPAAAGHALPGKDTQDLSVRLDNAIRAHAEWKTKLRTAIQKKEALDADTIGRDDCCELGKWLHGKGRSQYGGRPSFTHLVDEHRHFHQQAGKVAQTINRGAYQEAEQQIASGSAFFEASQRVGRAIVQLANEVKGKGGRGATAAGAASASAPAPQLRRPDAASLHGKASHADEGEWESF